MQITVLLEPMNGQGFRATGCEPFAFAAEGATREEALNRLKSQVQARLSGGAEVVALDVAPQEHPLMKFAGMFKDDPFFDEWQQAIAEYRDKIDKDDDYL